VSGDLFGLALAHFAQVLLVFRIVRLQDCLFPFGETLLKRAAQKPAAKVGELGGFFDVAVNFNLVC
jgi:hypothetical protein